MSTLIVRATAPLIAILMGLFSIIVLLRGHNDLGGGFVGGLIAASAVATLGMSHGVDAVRKLGRVDPVVVAGLGVVVSALSGVPSLLAGAPFLTGLWLPAHLFGTPGLFDVGVYLTVFGAVSAIALALEDSGADA